MRVCMLIWNYWPGPEGGAERQCRRLARVLGKRGIVCSIVTRRSSWKHPASETVEGNLIRRVSITEPFWDRLIGSLSRHRDRDAATDPSQDVLRSKERVICQARAWRPRHLLMRASRCAFMASSWRVLREVGSSAAIFHVHESHWLAGWGGFMAHRLCLPWTVKEAIIPCLEPLDPATPRRQLLDQMRRAGFFFAQTSAAADELRKSGVSGDRIYVVPNGVEIAPEPADVRHSQNVLFVGNLRGGYKAEDVLLDAWTRVASACPWAHLVMVGDGGRERLSPLIRQRGLTHCVTAVGRVSDTDAYYRAAAVFVLPSRKEGMSNALLEAQSYGLPAVVSDIPGNRAVVEQNRTGLIVPVGEADLLAENIIRLLRDSDARARMGEAARVRIRDLFSMDIVAERVINSYQDILNRCSTGKRPCFSMTQG